MSCSRLSLLVLILLFSGFHGELAYGQNTKEDEGLFNKLLAPGPLIEGHKDLEHDGCLKYHDAGKGVPDRKCLACHTDINRSIKSGDSFHANVKGDCISCHTDHKGRAFDSVTVDTKAFNHNLTGFALHGTHARINCTDCHTERKNGDIRFFGQNDSCISCHRKDDPHFFPPKWAAKECSTCHNDVSWKQAAFDHKRHTGFDLIGHHGKLECAACHAPSGKSSARYNFPELPTQGCLTCHTDHHKANLSPKFRGGMCDRCHSQSTWNIANFNHDITGFPLRGAHAKQQCIRCHRQAAGALRTDDPRFKFEGVSDSCVSCHKDFHGFQNQTSAHLGRLADCETCHNEVAWHLGIGFNHNSDTSFPITGKHAGVKCFECHKPMSGRESLRPNLPRLYDFPTLESKPCETCHTNPHKNNPSPAFRQKCSSCHTTAGWNIMATGPGGFNHDTMTRFPLTGDHENISCKGCHLKKGRDVFKFPGAKKQFCESCHSSPHKGQFHRKFTEASCATCHNTSEFSSLDFDHDLARFDLTGAHKKIERQCEECHVPTKRMLATKPPRPARRFIFPLREGGFCSGCHLNVHKGQFSKEFAKKPCQECHSTVDFEHRLPFNHNKTNFKLTGAHQKIKENCQTCHVKTKNRLPTKPPKRAGKFRFDFAKKGYCESCHINEHKGGQFHEVFANWSCGRCHNTTNFDGKFKFDHHHSQFPLKGKHRKLACDQCHVDTKQRYKTPPHHPMGKFIFAHLMSKDCATCHQDPHKGAFGPNCSKCHTEKGWDYTANFHRNFILSGAHYLLACSECHQGEKELGGIADDCQTCHLKDDVHTGALPNCGECHTQYFWNAARFQHSLTSFPLRGSHRLLDCSECHQGGVYEGKVGECVVCHFEDAQQVTFPDHRLGSFQQCDDCHNQFRFGGATK